MRWVDSDVPIQSLGHVWLSVTPWTGFSVHGFFKTRVVEWVAISSSRGSSLPRDKICVTCIDRWLLYHWATWQAHLLGISSVTQSCPSLCDPVDCSTPVFPVHHQLPELTQTHVHLVSDAIQPSHPLSSSSPPACTGCGGLVNKSCLTLVTPWTIACQAPLSMGLSRPEYWNGLPFPSRVDLPDPGIKTRSPALQAESLPAELLGKP